jgi:hypothetical protein
MTTRVRIGRFAWYMFVVLLFALHVTYLAAGTAYYLSRLFGAA